MESRNEVSPQQFVALMFETERAVELFNAGVEGVRRLDMANDECNVPQTLLAQGIERLLKLTIVLDQVHISNTMPKSETLKKRFGHDLIKLKDAVSAIANRTDSELAAALQAPTELTVLLAILADFGKQGRYHPVLRLKS